MTKEKAKIILLEQSLDDAIHTIEFLEKCILLPDNYVYTFPEQTQMKLKEYRTLVNYKEICFHSIDNVNCKGCQNRKKEFIKRQEALKILTEK